MNGRPAKLVDNAAFHPGPTAVAAPPFRGSLRISRAQMQLTPELAVPLVGGRDARLFPSLQLDFYTLDEVLVPVQRGQIVGDDPQSYWSVIPQFGRVWRDADENGESGGWSNAAFPLMLVNDGENLAHQGLASFRYRQGKVSELRFQFVQQTSPYLLKQHFIAAGSAELELADLTDTDPGAARRELAARLPNRPWSDLDSRVGSATLAGFGGLQLAAGWIVAAAIVRDGTLYYGESQTPRGLYPYPLEMRFGVRSVMKGVAAPLSLLRLAQLHGPDVLSAKIGQYVPGLHPKFDSVRFIDAANMATGFGGTGTLRTRPNDFEDGYLEADYDGWYTAASHQEKLAHMSKWLQPYPWDPGTIARYRDQDYYVLGAAVDAFLKSVRGPDADVWDMLCDEVFAPIGIAAAPAARTREPGGKRGLVLFSAGYFPTLEDIAKIALLYQRRGEWDGQQILHRELTQELLAGQGALPKNGGVASGTDPGGAASVPDPGHDRAARDSTAHGQSTHYKMGFHFTPYRGQPGAVYSLPNLWGAGESEVILYPDGSVSIRIGKAAGLPL